MVALTTCTVAIDPGARSTAVQWSVSVGGLPWIEQLAGPDMIDQSMPVPEGNGSSMTTPWAVPVPGAVLLLTLTVKPICEPASTVGASAVLVRVRSEHATRVETLASSFMYVPQLANDVALTTWAVTLCPEARSTGLQTSASFGGLPWIVQFAEPVAIDQSMPGPPGKPSLMMTSRAVPVPGAGAIRDCVGEADLRAGVHDCGVGRLGKLRSLHWIVTLACCCRHPCHSTS